MKVLILGVNGMAGHMIALYLKEQGFNVLGLARKSSSIAETVLCDVRDTNAVKDTICNGEFDAVVNCIGILNQAAEENKENSVFINGYFPHFLAEITKNMKTQIIHVSTDCVFSGRTGGYTEQSIPDGETFYDRTKAMGELCDEKNITLRSSIIGPDINKQGIGLLHWFMNQRGTISGYTKAIWTGQTTLQLAKTIEQVLLKKPTGLVNMVPSISINKYELLKLCHKYFKNDIINIVPVDGVDLNKTLVRTNFEFDYVVPDYEQMIKELAEFIDCRKDLYHGYH